MSKDKMLEKAKRVEDQGAQRQSATPGTLCII